MLNTKTFSLSGGIVLLDTFIGLSLHGSLFIHELYFILLLLVSTTFLFWTQTTFEYERFSLAADSTKGRPSSTTLHRSYYHSLYHSFISSPFVGIVLSFSTIQPFMGIAPYTLHKIGTLLSAHTPTS